jgi:hypothetical protein
MGISHPWVVSGPVRFGEVTFFTANLTHVMGNSALANGAIGLHCNLKPRRGMLDFSKPTGWNVRYVLR